MSDDDRLAPFLITIPQEKAVGWLKRGFRSSEVRLLKMSREAFVLALPAKLRPSVQIGNLLRLKYDDELWVVRCESIETLPDGTYRVTFHREQDLTKMQMQSLKVLPGDNSLNVRQHDPLLPAGVLLAIVITVLVTPGWGDQLGTSTLLTDAVSSVVASVRDVFASIGGR